MAREQIGVMALLSGRPEDYVGAETALVGKQIGALIHQYAEAGGDLSDFTVFVQPNNDLGPRGTQFSLRGHAA